MQTILVFCLIYALGVLGHPQDLNEDIDEDDHESKWIDRDEHRKITEDLKRRNVKCELSKRHCEKELQNNKKMVTALNQTLKETEEMVEACKLRNVQYLETNQKLIKEDRWLKKELEECRKKQKLAESTEKDLQDQLEEAKATIEKQKKIIQALEIWKKDCFNDKERLLEVNKDQEDKIAELQKTIEQQKTDLEAKDNELKDKDQKIEELQQKLEECEQKLKDENEELQKTIEQQKADIEAKDNEIKDKDQKIEELDQKLEQLKDEIKKAEEAKQECEETAKNNEKKIKELETKLKECKDKYKSLENDKAALDVSVSALESNIKAAEDNIKDIKSKLKRNSSSNNEANEVEDDSEPKKLRSSKNIKLPARAAHTKKKRLSGKKATGQAALNIKQAHKLNLLRRQRKRFQELKALRMRKAAG